MRQVSRFLVLAFVATMLVSAASAESARAGGSWFDPVADRYEPGQTATLVGYSGGGVLGSSADGPFYGYLFKAVDDLSIAPRAIPLPLGEIDVSATAETGMFATRAAISFPIPEWVSPGTYRFEYCNAGCEQQLGDLIGGFLYIGVDPEYQVTREWPRNELEIANLAPDALLVNFGGTISAEELQLQPTILRMSDAYKSCVLQAGFTADLGAQVLLTDDGEPYHVKTSPEVPAAFHGSCFSQIGGPVTTGSSWGMATGVCRVPIASIGCAPSNDG